MSEELIQVDAREVMFLIHRDRDQKEFELVKESVRAIGIRIPLQVRSITHWPVERRRRPDGGTYKWQAFFGEGRARIATELAEETGDESWFKLPATKEDVPESEIASRFLTENLLRNPLSWQEQAQLIRGEAEALAAGGPITKKLVAQLAKAYFVTPAHVVKLLRVLQKLSPELERELKGLTLQEAETLTTLPAAGQNIVMETLHEEGLRGSDTAAVVRRVRRLVEEGAPLSKIALRASLKRLREDLERERKTAKPLRLHYALGPENLRVILADKQWRRRLEKAGINFAKFEETK